MSARWKVLLIALMSLALMFGYLKRLLPGWQLHDFERLHIFLFNMVAGGTILLHYSERRAGRRDKRFSRRVTAYLVLGTAFTLAVYFDRYIIAMALLVPLAVIVESVRMRLFPAFPMDFFRTAVPVWRKFHHASILCLSIALLFSGLVVLNHRYLKLVSLPALELDDFFLGFSFPLSLITMSVMFESMRRDFGRLVSILRHASFWAVNLGVIVFFVFIVVSNRNAELIMALLLTATVVVIFVLFVGHERNVQQEAFFTSGMIFLLFTGVTGVLWVVLSYLPPNPGLSWLVLQVHAFAALYGWNLSGLAVVSRYEEFPIRLNSRFVLGLHWVTIVVLAPLGLYQRSIAVVATLCYASLLVAVFFSPGHADERVAGGEA